MRGDTSVGPQDREEMSEDAAKLTVIGIAVSALGKLALRDSGSAYLTAHERTECYQALIDALGVLNNEKDNS